LLVLLTVGLRLGVGPFFFPISRDLGFSRSMLSSIVAIAMLSYGLVMPLAGWLVGRIGTRATLLAGLALIVLGTIWTATAETPVVFTLAFGIILSVGLGLVSPVTLTPIITRWFTQHRGMALFFLSTGGMAGLAVATTLFSWAIERFSWQQTMLGYVVILALVAVPGTLLLMRDTAPVQADTTPGTDNKPDKRSHNLSTLSTRRAFSTAHF